MSINLNALMGETLNADFAKQVFKPVLEKEAEKVARTAIQIEADRKAYNADSINIDAYGDAIAKQGYEYLTAYPNGERLNAYDAMVEKTSTSCIHFFNGKACGKRASKYFVEAIAETLEPYADYCIKDGKLAYKLCSKYDVNKLYATEITVDFSGLDRKTAKTDKVDIPTAETLAKLVIIAYTAKVKRYNDAKKGICTHAVIE